MQIPPASVLKTWPKPNYDNPETRGYVKIILNIVLYSVLVCFMSLRIFTRTYLRKIFGADDILILLAMVRLLRLLLCPQGEAYRLIVSNNCFLYHKYSRGYKTILDITFSELITEK